MQHCRGQGLPLPDSRSHYGNHHRCRSKHQQSRDQDTTPCKELPHGCLFGTGAHRPAAVEAGQWPLTRFCLSDLLQTYGTGHCYTQELGNMTVTFSTSLARKVEWRLGKPSHIMSCSRQVRNTVPAKVQ